MRFGGRANSIRDFLYSLFCAIPILIPKFATPIYNRCKSGCGCFRVFLWWTNFAWVEGYSLSAYPLASSNALMLFVPFCLFSFARPIWYSCGHNFLCLAIGKTIPNYHRGADLAPDGLSFLSLGTTHSLHSGSLLQLIQRFIHAVWERSIPSKLSSNLWLHISKLSNPSALPVLELKA